MAEEKKTEKLNAEQKKFLARKKATIFGRKSEGWKDGPFQTFMSVDKSDNKPIRLNFRDLEVARLEKKRIRTDEEKLESPGRNAVWEVLEQCSYKDLKFAKDKIAFKKINKKS